MDIEVKSVCLPYQSKGKVFRREEWERDLKKHGSPFRSNEELQDFIDLIREAPSRMTMNEEERVVLDTSVVSILSRPDDFRYFYYQQRLEGLKLTISFQTLEERWFGAYNRDWGEKRQRGIRGLPCQF